MSQYIINPFFEFGQPPLAPTRNAWRELGRTVLGGDSSIISVNVPNVRYYMLLSRLFKGANFADSGYTINSDVGANYANRASIDGGVDFTQFPENKMGDDAFNDNKPMFRVDYLDNNPTKERLVTGHVAQQNVAGSATAPRRVECTGKWNNALDQITSIQVVNNSPTATYIAPSELVVLGFDPADGLDASANFWEPLAVAQGPAILGTGAISFISTPTFPARKYLWIQGYIHQKPSSGVINQLFNFNGSDPFSATEYSERFSDNGGADVFPINRGNIQTLVNGSNGNALAELFVVNDDGEEKLVIEHMANNENDGAGFVPNRREGVAKYIITAGQITKVSMLEGTTGTFDDKSFLKVWGHN